MGKESNRLRKISIARLKEEMQDTVFLSDELAITSIDNLRNPTSEIPISLDGFAAMILMSGSAQLSIDTDIYEVRPDMLVFFRPGSVIRTIRCSTDAMAYLVACSKSFVNEIQVDISASLPIHMRFGRKPCLQVTERDVEEIRQFFQLIKTVIVSDKERYRKEIIHTIFTAIFYLITELNQREEIDNQRRGRGEVIFDRFMQLLAEHNKQERNVSYYAEQLKITPKYLSSVVKEVSGKTAAHWIDESVILEAKSLLKYSGLSIQEIAYQLNFSTQSFFGKYFKQHTGTSPSRYKRKG
jgi:AraC-like DNA-binding protein